MRKANLSHLLREICWNTLNLYNEVVLCLWQWFDCFFGQGLCFRFCFYLCSRLSFRSEFRLSLGLVGTSFGFELRATNPSLRLNLNLNL